METKELRLFDVVLACFPYQEGDAKKLRPGLVLEVGLNGVRLAYGTSNYALAHSAMCFVTVPDSSNQLARPTIFQMDHTEFIPSDDVRRRLGRLSKRDRQAAIDALMARYKRLHT